jgi:transcriptional regulator with XRE-family HTH domain
MPPLTQLRRYAGYSLRALAKASGLSLSTLVRLETGATRRPHPRTIATIARVLGVDPATIDEFRNGHDRSRPISTPQPQ